LRSLHDLRLLVTTADITAAMSVEALLGTDRVFADDLQQLRPQPGQALSAANTALYGIVHAVIVSLGCAPGLGFVHTGHERSFVYDIADLYKAELTIPIAFEIAGSGTDDIGPAARRAVRDRVFSGRLLERCVTDVQHLLLGDAAAAEMFEADVVWLWDGADRVVAGGVSYEDSSVYTDPSMPFPS